MKASDAAYEVLAAAGEPLHVKELTDRMVTTGLWQTQGKTPWDTLAAILGTEINELGAASRFSRPSANTFALRKPDDPIPLVALNTSGPKAWMFQGNPVRYDLLTGIAAGSISNYAMNQHRDHAAYGDRAFFFLSGDKAGMYAVGRVTSTAYRAEQANEFGEWKVDVAFEATIDPPLLRAEMMGDPLLASFGPFAGRMGTNFPMPTDVAARLEMVLAPRLHPVHSASTKRFDPVGYALDQTLEAARQTVKDELLAHLRGLKPPEFEKVVLLLLQALKYEDVKVTGKAGDHGIDVRAVLRYRGVADVPTYVQAKRFGAGNNVDPAVIGRLRGSLPVQAHGIVITTSDFTKQARTEATMDGLKPIALVNGPELVELLIDLGIGVEKRQVEVLRLAPDKLASDLAG
ncbi:MAG: hypothetical protein A2W26_10795 [Acidobacteria bacterium RBG_16_64_8]|nr:MAG: hypothetical protein A2W26_10795 [Acidobacteria bacterium RBG_16_64_8]